MGRRPAVVTMVIVLQGDFVPPQYAETMPSLIYGVLMLAGGLLSVGLPDTTGYDLPETVAEAELFPP